VPEAVVMPAHEMRRMAGASTTEVRTMSATNVRTMSATNVRSVSTTDVRSMSSPMTTPTMPTAAVTTPVAAASENVRCNRQTAKRKNGG
jgi:hypothetical protein